MENAGENIQIRPLSIKLWPPSQSTRLMLVKRMTTNFSSPSLFSKKYGLLSEEEAKIHARHIEDVAFAAANEHHEKEPDGNGSSAVQLYAKKSSKLMLEVLKRGPREKEEPKLPASKEILIPPKAVFDISGGTRDFIEAEEAKELLKPLTDPANSYSKICFSNRSFGIGAAQVAEPILVSLREQLTEVDLSDFIAGRPVEEALEVMSIFSSALEGCVLRYLDLSYNALGEKGIRAFGSLLKSQRSLEELYFINNGISEGAARAIQEFVPSTEKLKVLHFHNGMTGDEGAIAISKIVRSSSALEDFRCSTTRVGSEGGIALAKGLGACPNLKKLDLRDNVFSVDAGIALSQTLSGLSNLTEAYLSDINLEDKGTIALANALKDSAPLLIALEMGGNDITVEAAPALAACFSKKDKLSKVSLAENELKDEGLILIAEALGQGHAALEELDLSSNLIRRVGARVLAQAVSKIPGFKLLNINGNYISKEGIDEVKEILNAGSNSDSVLGPLDENDAEGGDEEDETEVVKGGEDQDEELESKLQYPKVDQE